VLKGYSTFFGNRLILQLPQSYRLRIHSADFLIFRRISVTSFWSHTMEVNGTRNYLVKPLLFFSKDILGFLMTTQSQDFGLMSHPKDGALWQYGVPITH